MIKSPNVADAHAYLLIPDSILKLLPELPSLTIDAEPLQVSNISIKLVVSISMVLYFLSLKEDCS